MQAFVIDPTSLRDLAPDVLDAPGRPRVMPAAYYRDTTMAERAAFGVRNGIYSLPTKELIDWLVKKINGRSAIEIGSGHGALAAALGIPATDSRQQEDPLVASHYASVNQPVIQYGANVEKLDAATAIAKYKPKVVIASWVTHKYVRSRHEAGGNQNGVNEESVIASCDAYIFIGNSHVHSTKSIWSLPNERIEPDWLFSRAYNGSPEFIAVWGA